MNITGDEIKILMIDDDEEDFMIVRDIIQDIVHRKYSIDWASSYDEGLRIIAEKKHDVYIVDYRLGPHNGLDLIREAIRIGCREPLIIMTGQNDFTIDEQAMQAGASDYMVKGTISGQILERSIRYAMANSRHNKEMRRLNAELEERVKSRTAELEETLRELEESQKELLVAKNTAEKAAEKAEAAAKAKQQFLSNMSHEIRTPMNAIIGFTKLMMKTELSDDQHKYMDAIRIAGDTLIVLINDILDLAKVDAGKMTFEKIPFKLSASVQSMLHLFDAKIQEKKLTLVHHFDPSIPEVLLGDPVRLQQIILNLVSNAIKFTARGQITVDVQLLDEDEEKVTIEFLVTDTGIGIDETKLNQIFDTFQQASKETSRVFGGTGLGLTIAKQLVVLQGGKLTVKSKVDEGSCFSFTLGFIKTNARAKKEEDMPVQANLNNVRVLVAEDNALNQLLMKTLLSTFGFEREIAGNGKIAIEKLREKEYDIVLMDLRMPEMDGLEATEYIRKNLKSDIPVIALTADVTSEDVERCREVGMNDYIAKPVQEKVLYNMIVKHLKISPDGVNEKQTVK